MKKAGLLVLVVMFACVASRVVFGAEEKIAVVDMEGLVKAHPETKSAESLLQKQVEEFETEQKDLMSEYEKMKKSFEESSKDARNKALSEAEREKKMTIAEEKLADLREHERKMRETSDQRQKQLREQSTRMRRRIIAKIRDVISEYAGKKGYTLVLDCSGGSFSGAEMVVYSTEKMDITADIRKLIGEEKVQAKGEEKSEGKKETEK